MYTPYFQGAKLREAKEARGLTASAPKLALKEADLVIVLVDDRHPDDHSNI